MWNLYILQCRDGSLYTGVTIDIPNRLKRHNSGKGAKYTSARRPCRLVYYEEYHSESEAKQREREIKGWRRKEKIDLIRGFPSSALEAILRNSGQ